MKADPDADGGQAPSAHGRLGAAHHGLERTLLRRLGPRYPRAQVALALALLHVVSLGSSGVLALYIAMPAATAIRLTLLAQALFAAADVVLWRVARRHLAAIEAGMRDPAAGARAERAREQALTAPLMWIRSPAALAALGAAALLYDAYATVALDIRWLGVLVLIASTAVGVGYWLMLAFLSVEHGLRPVLEDLPPGDGGARPAVLGLRWRLAAALPAINVITGVVVGAFFPGGQGQVDDLAVGLAAALAVSLSVSIGLTQLLADSVVTPIAELRDAAARVGRGDFTVHVPVIGADETGELTRTFNRMVTGLGQRERLREALGAYVDPELAARVEQEGIDLEGEEVEASVVFFDVRGFTAWAERRPAREVVGRLGELFDCLVPVVLEHGGHANKFVGDGLMAVFGAPERRPDHADRAASAALAGVERVRARCGPDLTVGAGVNSGPVIAGTLGGGGRLDFTVIGDTVNTAARVEAATRQTGDDVLITAATFERLGESRDGWVARPTATLKGKSEPVELFARPGRERDPEATDG